MKSGKRKTFSGINCVLAILVISACGGGGGGVGDGGSEECQNPFVIPGSGTAYITQGIVPPVSTGFDPTPGDPVEATVPTFAMTDADLLTPAYSIAINTQDNNIVVPVTGPVGRIVLYTAIDHGGVPPGMTWRLYSNNVLGTPWQVEAPPTGTDISYVSMPDPRFIITFPTGNISASYVKLVLDTTAVTPVIDFTEVIPLQVILGTPDISGCADV